jgi:hypothetical protein
MTYLLPKYLKCQLQSKISLEIRNFNAKTLLFYSIQKIISLVLMAEDIYLHKYFMNTS